MIVEWNVMMILTTIPNVITVIMKYVSLAAMANIPRFYFASLTSEHRMIKVSGLKLKITKYRSEHKPLQNVHCSLHFLRAIHKFFRLVYAAWSYYFMPFTAIFLNIRFMINPCKCWLNLPYDDPNYLSPSTECQEIQYLDNNVRQ